MLKMISYILAMIALLAIVGLLFCAGRSGERSRQDYEKPTKQNTAVQPSIEENSQQKSEAGVQKQEHQHGLWNKFLQLVNANDRAINAVSTSVIAAFTFSLFLTSLGLWKAGEKQLSLAERTAERQLRAYVSGWPVHISSFDKEHFAVANIALTNIGQTPAYNFRHRACVIVAPYPLPSAYKFPPLTGDYAPPLVLFPNRPFTGTKGADSLFTEAQISAIKSGTMRIYIYGEIRYETSFRKDAWSTFAASVTADAATVEKLSSNYLGTDLIISYEVAPIGNEADRN